MIHCGNQSCYVMFPGLWDVLSSQMAVDFARQRLRLHNDPAACSRDLVRR